ncbi:unnamed protein product [Closterium sp. Yama58-4]|nr:unnamed protein product [Closterium sp. Yama58-4]
MAASLALSLSHIAPLHSPLFRPRRRLLATQPLLRRAVDSGALRVHVPRGMAAAAAAAAGGAAGPVVADERAGDAVVVYITVPNKETGQKLAASLVGAKLAACVNRVPGVESTYWWEGKIETDNEELLIVKTQRALLPSIQEHLKGNHPYDVPELIALPIVGGSEAYLKWLHDNAPVPPTQPPA